MNEENHWSKTVLYKTLEKSLRDTESISVCSYGNTIGMSEIV